MGSKPISVSIFIDILSGCSSVGRMPGLGPGGPPFESEYPDHIFILEVSQK